MTKKHFISLANVIKESRQQSEGLVFNETTIEYLADWLETQNPRFNRERWLGYIAGTNGSCGGKVKP